MVDVRMRELRTYYNEETKLRHMEPFYSVASEIEMFQSNGARCITNYPMRRNTPEETGIFAELY